MVDNLMPREEQKPKPPPTAIDPLKSSRHKPVRKLGPFTIDKEIWKGLRSAVYLARDSRDSAPVALKVLYSQRDTPPDAQKKNMEAEAGRLRALNHPNIVSLRQRGVAEGLPYLSFPYIEGQSLDHAVSAKTMDMPEMLQIMVKVCRALGHAHSRGLFHRDLKPRNILIDGKNEPVVLDWGLSWKKGDKAERGVQQIVGTPAYMSPEQARGEEERLTEATDVYSLGAILYHVVTGKPPFEADTSWKTMQMAMSLPPHPPSLMRTTVDLRVERVILSCLQKEPEKRYCDANELADDLQRAVDMQKPKGPSTAFGRFLKGR
jgi:serine/threonine-protein kinase